jgi:putative FmdB family regulatory protein
MSVASRYHEQVPRYEYRCRACGDTFEQSRPMSESAAPAVCPQGHDDTVKLLSTVAVGGRAGSAGGFGESSARASRAAEPRSGGGCCGGACGCGG